MKMSAKNAHIEYIYITADILFKDLTFLFQYLIELAAYNERLNQGFQMVKLK